MSRRERPTGSEVELTPESVVFVRATRTEIEQQVAAAERAFEEATRDLEGARVAYAEAESLYMDQGTVRARDKRRDASDEYERREVLARRAAEKLDVARAQLAELDREDKQRELEALRAQLATFDLTIEQHAAEFVQIDRLVDSRVLAIAVDVRDVAAVHDRATAIAKELRLPEQAGPRPDLANVSLAVRRVISAARQQEGRDSLSAVWMQDAPDSRDWRLRGMSAGDLDDLERVRQEQRADAIERDRRAAFDAGTRARPPEPKPPEAKPQPEPPKEAAQ